jgi:hypothetical protein
MFDTVHWELQESGTFQSAECPIWQNVEEKEGIIQIAQYSPCYSI